MRNVQWPKKNRWSQCRGAPVTRSFHFVVSGGAPRHGSAPPLNGTSTRKKRLTLRGCILLAVFAGFWFYWSPRASVTGNFSFQDLVSIRWLVRTETLESILQITEQPDGTVLV